MSFVTSAMEEVSDQDFVFVHRLSESQKEFKGSVRVIPFCPYIMVKTFN